MIATARRTTRMHMVTAVIMAALVSMAPVDAAAAPESGAGAVAAVPPVRDVTDAHAPPTLGPVSGADVGHQDSQPLGEIGRRIAAAVDGDVIEIGPGIYRERIRIDRRITLVGVGHPIIDGGGAGDIVEIVASGATIRGFVIRRTGSDLDQENTAIRVLAAEVTVEENILDEVLFGIDLRDAPRSVVRRNRIGGKPLDIARRGDGLRLWRSDDTLVEGNEIHDGRDAVLWYSRGIVARGNRVHRCRYGLHLMYSDDVRIEGNRLHDNSVGVYVMYSRGIEFCGNQLLRNRGPSGYGLGLKEADHYVVSENFIAGNRVGVYLDGSPFSRRQPALFRHNLIASNDVGMTFLPAVHGNEIAGNNFVDNLEQIAVAGRGALDGNAFWSGERGNYWSDYTGYDQDRDGVGDFVHESSTIFEALIDREPALRLFLHSPVQQAIEFIGHAVPSMRPEPKFVDEVPLMRPVELAVVDPPLPGAGRRLALASALLLSIGGALVITAIGGCPHLRRLCGACGNRVTVEEPRP